MKIVFLGTGTSVGVPMIGCHCAVCESVDPRNRRLRSSLYIHAAGSHLVIDTPPDFREQALRQQLPRVDAVLFTHSHADHIMGLDDIRRFNTIQQCTIPAYASEQTISDLQRIFNYVQPEPTPGVYRPQMDFRPVGESFDIGDIHVEPLPVEHGDRTTLGYLLAAEGWRVGYVPDCHQMPDAIVARLKGVDLMILDALRDRPHTTHLTLEASLDLLRRISARQSYVTHLCHELEHSETEKRLPDTVHVAYDGLTIEL